MFTAVDKLWVTEHHGPRVGGRNGVRGNSLDLDPDSSEEPWRAAPVEAWPPSQSTYAGQQAPTLTAATAF